MSLRRLLRPIKRFKPRRLAVATARLCSRSPLLSGLYWTATGAFGREHRAVLYGQLLHARHLRGRRDDDRDDGPRYTLRRNVHRLEKGLIMRPRRPMFALDYVGETVDAFETFARAAVVGDNGTAAIGGEGDRLLAAWAGDVLHRYFDAVDAAAAPDPVAFGTQADRFRRAHAGLRVEVGDSAPYRRELAPLAISYDDLLALAKRRRSVRWYEQRPVDRAIVDRAVRVAAYSPSACNRQPFEFRLFDDPVRVREIASIAMGTRGFSDNFPGLAVLVGRLRAYFDPRDRHVIYIDASLAAMAFQFALEVQGVSSCCINWPDVRDREARIARALDLDADERVVMLLSYGHPDPDGLVPFSQKKSLDELRSYNRGVTSTSHPTHAP